MTSRGTVLGDRYRLTERIAGGGMGEVWRAADTVLNREVAVKVLRPQYAEDPIFLERFRAEARHAAGLSHNAVAAVYDFGEDVGSDGSEPTTAYLVMEHVAGEPLSAVIERDGALPPAQTLDVIGQAALGLQAAHDSGVVHRDIKPGNLLVLPDGGVKITDFGIARAANSAPLTQTGAIMGTAFYISPEQASGRSVTPASDIYSLGVVAYECLTGRRPFAGDTPVGVALAQVSQEPPALPEDLPSPVRDLVMRMLAKDPAARPASAGELGREALAMRSALTAAPSAAPAATRVLAPTGGDGPDTEPPRREETTVVAPVGTDTDPGFRLPDPKQARGWAGYAALLVALLLVLALVRACAGDEGTVATTPGSDTTSDEPTAATAIDVVAADYVGRPEQEVRSELTELGLAVDVRQVGGGEPGTVKDVSPTGQVAAGTTVTLDVVDATPDGRPPGKGKGKGKDKKGRG